MYLIPIRRVILGFSFSILVTVMLILHVNLAGSWCAQVSGKTLFWVWSRGDLRVRSTFDWWTE